MLSVNRIILQHDADYFLPSQTCFSCLLLLTPMIGVCHSVCLSVSLHDKPKTAETKITKFDAKFLHFVTMQPCSKVS